MQGVLNKQTERTTERVTPKYHQKIWELYTSCPQGMLCRRKRLIWVTGGVADAPPPVTQIVTFGDVTSSSKTKY